MKLTSGLLAALLVGAVLVAPTLAAPGDPVAAGRGSEEQLRALVSGVLLVIGLILAAGVVVVARTVLSVAALATWPEAIANAAGWVRARPWLCVGWGVPLMLLGVVLFSLLAQAGGAGGVLALGVLIGALAGLVFGFTALAEVAGERILALRHAGPPSRLAKVIAGSAALVITDLTPPGWLALVFFVLPCSIGAARFLRTPPPPYAAYAPTPNLDEVPPAG